MSLPVLMEIDPDKHEMWIRLSPKDSEYFRRYLRPGTHVSLHGCVAKYESSGGHADFEGDFLFASDRLQLSASSLGITITSPEDAP